MDRTALIRTCDSHVLHVRNEFSYNQEIMAHALGISKKTLVDIEKGRRSLGWEGSVALLALFADSRHLAAALGPDPLGLARTLMLDGHAPSGRVTHGGGWWTRIDTNECCTIEQNVVSQHYRLVDANRHHLLSSLSYDEVHAAFVAHTSRLTAKE